MFAKETKILIVEDMASMRKLVMKHLKDLGYTNVTDAVDGDDAWKKIQDAQNAKSPFGLVISDWNMPKMKGYDLLLKVRGATALASTPFVLLTAEAERDQIAMAVKSGVSGYLLKPFTKEQLATSLENVSSRKKAA